MTKIWRKSTKMNGPLTLSWDITNKCNFNCNHCLNRSGDIKKHNFLEELSEVEIADCIEQIIELNPETICLCGGEPTMNPFIFDIISRLRKANIKVNMVSNGFFMDKKFVEALKKVDISFVQISLDSHIEEQHDEFRSYRGAFKKACEAIKNLNNIKIPFAIAMCPTKFNCDNFAEYVEFVKNMGCKFLRIMPLLPMGRGLDNFKRLEPSSYNYMKLQREINLINGNDIYIEWGDPLDHIVKAIEYGRSFPVSIEIKSNGDIGVSIYLPISVGNIRRHRLKEYWDNGLDSIWTNPDIIKIAKKIESLEDFKKRSLQTWSIVRKDIDIINDNK